MIEEPPNKLLLQAIWVDTPLLMKQFRTHSSPYLETTWLKAIKNNFTVNNQLQGASDLILACLQGLVVNKSISPTWPF